MVASLALRSGSRIGFVGYFEDCFDWCFKDGFKDCSQELGAESSRLS